MAVSLLAGMAYVAGTALVIFGCLPVCTNPVAAYVIGVVLLIRAMSFSVADVSERRMAL